MTSRISLFSNQKKNPNHPDLRGEIHLTVGLIQELAYYVNRGERLVQGYGQNAEPGITVRLSCWGQQPDSQKPNGPVLTGSLESPAETDQRAKERAAREQQSAGPPPYNGPATTAAAAAPQPPQPVWDASTGQWVLPPVAPVPPKPVWDASTGQWTLPGTPPPGPQPGLLEAPPPGPQLGGVAPAGPYLI